MTRDAIFKFAKENYGTIPEYLWKSAPEHAVLRNAASSKWYAIIMKVSKKSLGLQGEGDIDIVNVKCDPLMVGSLRMQKGFLPAYHINKTNWVSIILNGEASDEMIFELIDQSYDMVSPNLKY